MQVLHLFIFDLFVIACLFVFLVYKYRNMFLNENPCLICCQSKVVILVALPSFVQLSMCCAPVLPCPGLVCRL